MDARIFLVAAGLAFFPQEQAAREDVELKGVGVATKDRANLCLEGRTSALPNDALLNVLLFRIEERSAGGRLVAHESPVHSELVRVETGKFAYVAPADSPPVSYRVAVRLTEEMQRVQPLQRLKGAGVAMPREWSLGCSAWGDDQAGQMGSALTKIDEMVAQAKKLVGEFEKACTHRDLWSQQHKGLDGKAGNLLDTISRPGAGRFYAAAAGEITDALGTVRANANCAQFKENGSFDKFSNYHEPGKPPQFRGKDFGWGVAREFLEGVPELAGREFALWAVKDIRRAGRVTEALSRAVGEQARHPGLSPRVDALLRGEGLDELEKEIRKKPE